MANSSYHFSTSSDFVHSQSQRLSSTPHYINTITSRSLSYENSPSSKYRHDGNLVTSRGGVTSYMPLKESKSESFYTSRNQPISFSLDKTFTRNSRTTSLPPASFRATQDSLKIPKFISSIFVVPSRENNSQIFSEDNFERESNNLHFRDEILGNSSSVALTSESNGKILVHSPVDAENQSRHSNTSAEASRGRSSTKHTYSSSKIGSSHTAHRANASIGTPPKPHRKHSTTPRFPNHFKNGGKLLRHHQHASKTHKTQHPPQVLSFMSGSVHSLHSARRRSFVPVPSTSGPGAFFDPNSPSNISAQLGSSAYLPCKIRNLGNKTVSVGLPLFLFA